MEISGGLCFRRLVFAFGGLDFVFGGRVGLFPTDPPLRLFEPNRFRTVTVGVFRPGSSSAFGEFQHKQFFIEPVQDHDCTLPVGEVAWPTGELLKSAEVQPLLLLGSLSAGSSRQRRWLCL
ncbi:MAG: hypothetical protein JWM99_862 [Verrucomicrobiales bacterium]|nr:hypothetical protein [Verrucomicrobiales bacterium]